MISGVDNNPIIKRKKNLKMKLIITAFLLAILSGCGQNQIQVKEKSKKIGIHIFTPKALENQPLKWYYIRDINGSGNKGYYFESEKTVENFTEVNFVYYDTRPDKFEELYPVKEKLLLVNPNNLPENVQQSIAELESISVSE